MSKIFDLASYLPARSLPAAALLALRRRPAAYGIRHTVAPMTALNRGILFINNVGLTQRLTPNREP
ncbi:MAG: hypothetical protein ACR2L2_11280 [Acidobacteriota bacterium]